MHGIGDMGRGRKKAVVHPGQPCGPCHLCQQSSSRYCHIATWDEDLKCKMKDLTAIGEDKCICRACETDFKTNIGKNDYTYRWMRAIGKQPGLSRELVVYIGDCFLRIAPTYLKEHQKLVVGGASDTLERDQAWSITENALEHIETCYRSNAEEADTRVWLHATHSAGRRKLIFSPDTDVYHIGLTCAELASTNTIVQLSALGRELRLLNLNELDNALKLDPDLHTLIPERRREILQVIYVTTGCDFTSFFSGIGKVAFLKAFYCYSKFITTPGEHTPGSLTDISPESHGFLSFIRLVGVAYFIKHKPAFAAETPSSQFQGFYAPGANSEEHHMQWYNEYLR